MASTVYETLQEIENGRKHCIANAKIANLPATDNMDISSLGDLFLLQNNTENINPNDPTQGGGWHRPSDWWDCKTILQNAVVKDGLYPAYILLLPDLSDTTRFAKSAVTNATLQGDGYLTSDGSWYVSTDVTHTWDKTKDRECSEGYNTRYVIVYVSNKNSLSGTIELAKFPCLECILGDVTIGQNQFRCGSSNANNSNALIRNIEALNSTNYTTINTTYFCSQCLSLQNVSFPNLTSLAGQSPFTGCKSLTNVSLPNLTTIGASNAFGECSSLVNVSFPNLTTITNSSVFYACYSLVNVSFPNLTTIGTSAFSQCCSLVNVSFPNLTAITGNNFEYCRNLIYVSLPNVIKYDGNNIFSLCTKLNKFTIPSTIVKFTGSSNFFNNCAALMELNIFNGFKFSGLNLSSCINMKQDSLRDIIDKLGDVTNENGTYTLILGSTNLAKLTAAEIAVATNKGWTLS